jgi:hypothetical protein
MSRPYGWCETRHRVAENHPAHRPLSRHSVQRLICTQPDCRATTCRGRQHRHHERDISHPYGWCKTHHGVAENHPAHRPLSRHSVLCPICTQPECRATTCRGRQHRHHERDISHPYGWCETHHGVAEKHPVHRPLSRHGVQCPCTQPERRATTCRGRQHRHHGHDISHPHGSCKAPHGVAEKHPPPVVGPRHVVAASSATTAPQPFVVHCVGIILDNPFVWRLQELSATRLLD